MKKFITQALLVLSLIFLSGCYANRAMKLEEISPDQLKNISKNKVKVFIDWKFNSIFAIGDKARDKQLSLHLKMFHDALAQSECCEVLADKFLADVVIEGGFYDDSDARAIFFATITGASMYIIPSWLNEHLRLSATVKTKKNEVFVYDVTDSMFFAQWLPFILIMPFQDSLMTTEKEMMNNLYKNLVHKMQWDGVLDDLSKRKKY